MKDGWRLWPLACLLLLLFQASCTMPRDPENTTETVRHHVMFVGVSENPPWVTRGDDDTPGGIEVRLVQQFARQIDAEVEWQWGTVAQHLEALHQFELHMAIGGLTTTTPGSAMVAMTQPYYVSEIIVALPPGVPAAQRLDGAQLAVVRGAALADIVRDNGAEPVFFSDWQDLDKPAAVPAWQAQERHLRPTTISLDRLQYAMAVPPGENRWLTELEKFLMQQSVTP